MTFPENTIYCLLIDDQPEEEEIFRYALNRTGIPFHFEYAVNSEQALAKLNAEQLLPDIIFLDWSMPRVTGREFLQTIKQTGHLENIPVYIYSISAFEEQKKEFMAMGASYLEKPETVDALVRWLKEILSRHKVSAV